MKVISRVIDNISYLNFCTEVYIIYGRVVCSDDFSFQTVMRSIAESILRAPSI